MFLNFLYHLTLTGLLKHADYLLLVVLDTGHRHQVITHTYCVDLHFFSEARLEKLDQLCLDINIVY